MSIKDRFRGCMLAGAAGDALGYTVEFWDEDLIFQTYGELGIQDYRLVNGVAQISDDTQMTLFTADGLLLADEDYLDSIRKCYIDWGNTQMGRGNAGMEGYSSLMNIEKLFASRDPGRTCLNEVAYGAEGTMADPRNSSKGCGGIMRVAPIGLFFPNESLDQTAMLAAQAAALTHGHELGYLSAAAMAVMVAILAHTDRSVVYAAKKAIKVLRANFGQCSCLEELEEKIRLALRLAAEDMNDLEAIHRIGEGWVAEETLGIAIYCAAKYSHNLDKAITVSVNHEGDSDSVGAVTGNIIGAHLGRQAIPERFLDNLELAEFIGTMADRLYSMK